MAVAAWCSQCGAYVYLDENWSCPQGHGYQATSNWYDPDSGQPVTPYWAQAAVDAAVAAPVAAAPVAVPAEPAPAPAPAAPAPGTRLAVLGDILAQMARYPHYTAGYGATSDLLIHATVADAGGPSGRAYEAALKAVEADRTIRYWEAFGPTAAANGAWDYTPTRAIVEAALASAGWTVVAVGSRAEASW
jgi:hypothetical protein